MKKYQETIQRAKEHDCFFVWRSVGLTFTYNKKNIGFKRNPIQDF